MKFTETKFADHSAVELITNQMKIIVVTDIGPRIAFFGKADGENLLFWDDQNRGRDNWKIRGGHRVWVARPGADEAEETYLPDNDPCEIKIENNFLTVMGAIDPLLKIQRGIKIEILADNKLAVDNILINHSNMLYSGSIWALTCTNPKPNRQYGIPLGDDSSWDCFRIVYCKRWAKTSTSRINDPQIEFTEDMMLIKPQGVVTKRMIEAAKGIIAMDVPDQNTMFIKKVPYLRAGKHPLDCNLAFYIGQDNFMVEMETMGPEATLKPDESLIWRETWALTDKSYGLSSSAKIRELI
jgi:Tfp pilus assembly protein PilZ